MHFADYGSKSSYISTCLGAVGHVEAMKRPAAPTWRRLCLQRERPQKDQQALVLSAAKKKALTQRA